MSVLSTRQRKNLSSSQFAVPGKAPGSGSYPIPDASHARNALSRVAANGTPAEKAQVRSAVAHKFPEIAVSGIETAMGRHADALHPVKRK